MQRQGSGAPEKTETTKSVAESESSTTRVLVIDDDVSVVRFLKSFLTQRGFTVSTATAGDEALAIVSQNHPSIVLLDVRLPGMDGIEVLQRIKQLDARIDVIMITGFDDEESGPQAMAMGAFDYILKPFDIDYLERVLWWRLKMR